MILPLRYDNGFEQAEVPHFALKVGISMESSRSRGNKVKYTKHCVEASDLKLQMGVKKVERTAPTGREHLTNRS